MEKAEIEKQEELLLRQQELDNLLLAKDYVRAVGVALSLDQPYRLLALLQGTWACVGVCSTPTRHVGVCVGVWLYYYSYCYGYRIVRGRKSRWVKVYRNYPLTQTRPARYYPHTHTHTRPHHTHTQLLWCAILLAGTKMPSTVM